MSGSVVQIGTPGRGYNADDLEKRRLDILAAKMGDGDEKIRRQHIEAIKLAKTLEASLPAMRAYWDGVVGDKNAPDAIAMLTRIADQELAAEAAEKQIAAMRKAK